MRHANVAMKCWHQMRASHSDRPHIRLLRLTATLIITANDMTISAYDIEQQFRIKPSNKVMCTPQEMWPRPNEQKSETVISEITSLRSIF